MDREYFYVKQRQLEQERETELKRKQDNLDYHLKKNPSHSYASILICVMRCVKFKLENIKIQLLTQNTTDYVIVRIVINSFKTLGSRFL